MKIKKKGGLLWVEHPEFKRRDVFCTLPNTELYPAYGNWSLQDVSDLGKCVVVYSDPEGPMAQERDISQRIKGTLSYFGLPANSVVALELHEIGRLFLAMTHSFYEMIYDVDYELWISLKMQLHNFMAQLRSPMIGEKFSDMNARRNLVKDIEELKQDVQRIEAKVFKDMTLMKRVAEHITGKDKFDGYAEDYAISIDDLITKEHEDIFR